MPGEIDDLALRRAENFFRELKGKPFAALIFDREDVRLYTKGITENDLRMVMAMLEEASGEE